MRIGSRTRSIGLLLAALLLMPLPAASADTGPGDHVDGPDTATDAEISFEEVVYDMYFPIQGGAEYSDNFGDCRGGAGCPRTHHGIDIMQPKMTPVLAVASGYVGWIHNQQGGDCCAFEINHDDGWESWYIHLNNDTPGTDDGQGWGFAPGVEPGARIEAGQLVGWVGDSGNAENSGSHLHFELHRPGGIVINPYPSLQAATVLNSPLGNGHTRGCDFNDDGYDDLAIGIPGEDLSGNLSVDAGSVSAMYGSPDGLAAAGAQAINQKTKGVDGAAAIGDEFGFATACGDVNNDGHDDLIVGVPGEVVGGHPDAGAVNLILGSANGLAASGSNRWHQNRGGVNNSAEPGDRFGESLAIGDFNGDGFADVAVGVPGESIGGQAGAGMVTVLYGSGSGFNGDSVAIHEKKAGIGSPGAGDMFGAGLAAGDFDNDGRDDLAIGIPGEDSPAGADSGAVVVLYGSGSGLDLAASARFTQGTDGVGGDPNGGEMFGSALKSGDFDGDDHFDLAIGAPGDLVGGKAAGGVNVLYGSGSGLATAGSQLLQQGAGGLLGESTAGDQFGASLAVGDFDGDGNQDLGIGAPGKSVGGAANAGSVSVVYGTTDGLTGVGNDIWSQNSSGIKGLAQTDDRFASRIATGDFSGIGVSALAVGVPLEDVGKRADSGSIQVIRGKGGTGLTPAGDQRWTQKDLPGKPEAGDRFGRVAAPSA